MKNHTRSLAFFHTIRTKLLALMILLSLLPLIGMSVLTWFAGIEQIQLQTRSSLEKAAQDAADKLDIILRNKREWLHSTAVSYPQFSMHEMPDGSDNLVALLDEYFFNHEGNELFVVTDAAGKIMGVNSVDRNFTKFPQDRLTKVIGADISNWPAEHRMFLEAAHGRNSHTNWYSSDLVRGLYGENENSRLNIAFSEPLRDPVTDNVIGVWIDIVDGSYLDTVIYNTENDFNAMSPGTGRGFLIYDNDDGSLIRRGSGGNGTDNAGSRPAIDSGKFRDAVLAGATTCNYTTSDGVARMAGLARISDRSLGWIVGLEIDEKDLLSPIKTFAGWLFGACALFGVFGIGTALLFAGRITRPLNTLTMSASKVARGDFDIKLNIRSSDELGILASGFNEMARELTVRDEQIREMTLNLETLVINRTKELENANESLKQSYIDLQNTQEQLVHSEKMASLGQLVAGIAHEIKNPLNFIYGNTDFLREYTQKIQELVEKIEELPSISKDDRRKITEAKEAIQYDFIREDLRTLTDDLIEGTERINAIVSDLRIFSRMDTVEAVETDVHVLIDMSLNLLRNQYKDRIEVHRDYGDIPKIRCYAGKLNQVFMNLLSNAFYAVAEKGGVWIRTRPSGSNAVEIEIEDNGSGIPKENLKRLFEPFFTTKPVGQGTGLGLSISYGVIEQHHGKIRVWSVPGKGTLFSVYLPADQERTE